MKTFICNTFHTKHWKKLRMEGNVTNHIVIHYECQKCGRKFTKDL